MLRLRAEQMIALSSTALTRRIVVALSDRFPLETTAMSRVALSSLVRGAVGRAVAAGMRTEQQVTRYTVLALLVRPDFETSETTAWARPVLADEALSAERKLSRLYALARRAGYGVPGARDG
jgi:DNA-binding IclR family transcriptional regulator